MMPPDSDARHDKHDQDRLCWLIQKYVDKRSSMRDLKARKTK
jgi:hypothetical protein